MSESEPDPANLKALFERLMDDDEEARYDAANQIGRMGRQVLGHVMAVADDPQPRMREMACYILGQIGDADPSGNYVIARYRDGVPILLRLLESDPDHEVRASAATALGHQAVPSSLPPLSAASDPSPSVRFGIAFALGSFHELDWEGREGQPCRAKVIDVLLRLMDDEDDEVRDWATFGLHQGEHDTPEVRARFFQALDDPYPEVRGEAAWGLAKFGDRTLVPRLETLLREDEILPSLYFEAAEALGDPSLLPAVLEGAESWRECLDEGEELPSQVTCAIEALQRISVSA